MMIKTEYIVGDKVRVKSLGHNIYTVVRVEYTARNPYLLNTEGGFWYHADDLKPVLQEEPANEAQPVQPLTDLHAKIAALEAENARMKAELAEARMVIQNVVDNLPEKDESRNPSPKWVGIVFSAFIARNMLSSQLAPATSEDES